MSKKFQPPRGTCDFLPEEMILRERVFDIVKKVFQKWGFEPVVTPSLEHYEVFANKYAIGEENLKNVYVFEDKSGRKLTLRFDQTVPMARLVATNPQLPKPFRRYEISRVWRYEEVKRGRRREFWQCDIDVVGSKNMLADAEIIACTLDVLEALGFDDCYVRINNRKLLSGLIQFAGVDENKVMATFRSIDKLDKIGVEGVKKELKKKELREKSIEKILKFIKIEGKPREALKQVERLVGNIDIGRDGIAELKRLIDYLEKLGSKDVVIDLSLARGLDYYTSTIFEAMSEDKTIGSLAGGGRYDEMIGKFSGSKEEIPATGIALGIERIIELLKEKEKNKIKTLTKVFVANVSDNTKKDCLKIAQKLRKSGINTQTDIMGRGISKQLSYVNSLGIPYVVIVGSDEVKARKYKFKDMKTGGEKELSLEEIIKALSN